MSDECAEHDWQFATIAADPYNQINPTEYVYYFCKTCLKTEKRIVNKEPKQSERGE